MKVSGRPARLDYICASTDLLAATRWAGVRKDIDVRVGSARIIGLLLLMCIFRLESREKTKERKQCLLTATLFMTNKECGTFRINWSMLFLRDELEIGLLCGALTADVADAAIDCFNKKGQDEPRKGWISGNSWWLIKRAQSLRTDLRIARGESQRHAARCSLQ